MIARLSLALLLLAPSVASAQRVLLRRPYAESYRLNYGFDHDSGGGCSDYACMGACYNGHTGSDFGAPLGTTVLAGAAGRVVARNDGCADYGGLGNTCGGRCGNYVQLEHADGTRTIYCHMRNGSIRVNNGDTVTCGQPIGVSASSGNSTGPHLHLGWRPSASGASDDPFSGSCGGPISLWVEQRAYREAPSTSCRACTPSTEVCNGMDDDCDGRVDENAVAEICNGGDDDCDGRVDENATDEVCNGADDDCDGAADEDDVCEIRLLHWAPSAYASPTSTDVDGDGRADVCARGFSGVRCWPSVEGGWATDWPAVPWSDGTGWDDVTNFATIRMGDVDGDGLADVCARSDHGVVCARSNGAGFDEPTMWQAALSDDAGWNEPRYYTTIRLADVDGDGREDLCARGPEGFDCWSSDGAAFTTPIEGPRWSDEQGWGAARHYGTIRVADLDGDGRADVCARRVAGIRCHLAVDGGFGAPLDGPALGDDAGWGERSHWSTIRFPDVNADGRADLCARDAAGLFCHLGDGAGGFGERLDVAALADDMGWSDESNFATLRVGDLDGDGADDLCVRANMGMRCFAFDGAAFASLTGPAWSDDAGWTAARFHQTIRLVDVDGDGLADLCSRTATDWRCHASLGGGFAETPVLLDEMTDAGGWDAQRYWSTIQSASRTCHIVNESCNGRDDDCDGAIDEHAMQETCNGADDDCDGEVDEADACPPGVAPDAGVGPDGSTAPTMNPALGSLSGVCTCRAATPSGPSPAGLAWALLALVLWTRRR
ncbi:MAG: VCBS repeat domain-containing M23 family metallopeptidase [Sandaracinaceae bacterium]|nr:VCBS repeat domain-containing M23 family metallopeptidase [Sandaracinaceae bacterium]